MPTPLHLHPVDYFNFHGNFKDIFRYEKEEVCRVVSDKEVVCLDPDDLPAGLTGITYKLTSENNVSVLRGNNHGIEKGSIVSKFYVLSQVRFKGDYRGAESWVIYKLMDLEVPYVRVGTDYYSIEKKPDRYGGEYTTLKVWKKDTITEDHTKTILKIIPKYQDFIIAPDNKTYSPVHGRYYNLYAEFPHKLVDRPVTESDIPITLHLMRHIFGDQFHLGIRYMKVLYENPRQILPILVLVSEERETGKTTFLNYISMMFGENSILINPSDLLSNFNSSYATKNIILVDEAFVEKGLGVEKLKSIATAKKMSVNPKHVQGYSVDFFAKVIMCSNKELDFMRIDDAEIRFFIRKIRSVTGKRNTTIEDDLYKEIPAFLTYLTQQPVVDFTRSRMVFTKEEIMTEELTKVKANSRQSLVKDIEIRIREMFFEKPENNIIYASAVNIHDRWWRNSSQISPSYIKKVLDEELKIDPPRQIWYFPFNEGEKRKGRPYQFNRTRFLNEDEIKNLTTEDTEGFL